MPVLGSTISKKRKRVCRSETKTMKSNCNKMLRFIAVSNDWATLNWMLHFIIVFVYTGSPQINNKQRNKNYQAEFSETL